MNIKPQKVLYLLSVISLIVVFLGLFIEIPLIIINSLLIIMLSILTWVNYRNNKKMQMFIGILLLLFLLL